MPGYRCSHGDFETKVAELEKQGEVPVAVTTDDNGVYIITTTKAARRKPNQPETRS